MLYFKPMENKLRYPKWLLLFFAISVTSWVVSFVVMMIKLIIAIAIWQMPTITDWFGLWFMLSNLGIFLSVWFAQKHG